MIFNERAITMYPRAMLINYTHLDVCLHKRDVTHVDTRRGGLFRSSLFFLFRERLLSGPKKSFIGATEVGYERA